MKNEATKHFARIIPSRQLSSKELRPVACSVMENVTFRHSRNPIAQNGQSEPTLNEAFQLLQSVEQRLAQIESSLNLRITAVETSLEVAHEKIENLECKLASLETELQLQATVNRKAAIMHELRSKEFNLLFHGIPMNEKSETSETSEKIIRTFIFEKLHFSASSHFLERSSPSTENVCHYFIFFCCCTTACEIRDRERPELYLQPSFPCQTV